MKNNKKHGSIKCLNKAIYRQVWTLTTEVVDKIKLE